MALFEAKYCSLCETKLGLFGTTRLANGQLCKNCAGKLSPLLTHVKKRTLAEIQGHLIYREENLKKMENFHPDVVFGRTKKIYVDTKQRLFCVSRADYRSANADLISFDQIKDLDVTINEDKDEIYDVDKEGKSISFDPPKYQFEYEFNVQIEVNSPWFESISVDISDGDHPEEAWNESFTKYEEQLRKLWVAFGNEELKEPLWEAKKKEEVAEQKDDSKWLCVKCGAENTGKFCTECGSPKPAYKCAVCGYELKSREMLPRYCINCGSKMNQY